MKRPTWLHRDTPLIPLLDTEQPGTHYNAVWGMHVASGSTQFGAWRNVIAYRLLGWPRAYPRFWSD